MNKPKLRNWVGAFGIVTSILRVAPTYKRYQRATNRIIPIVRLVPIEQIGEPTLPSGEVQHDREELSFTE